MLGELEIAAFGADFRGDQQTRAVRVGEEGRVAVALQQVHVFVETGDGQRMPAAQAQRFFQRLHLGARAAKQQGFRRCDGIELAQQPIGARIAGEIVRGFVVVAAEVVRELGLQPATQGGVFVVGEQLHLGDAMRETADRSAAIPDHRAAGAMAIDQIGQQGVAGVGVAGGNFRQPSCQHIAFVGEHRRQRFHVAGGQALAGEQAIGQARQRDIALLFGLELREIGVTRGIEQSQASEVSAQAQLFRRGGEQDQAGRARREAFDQLVLATGRVRTPGQVMRLVHQQQIPAGIQGLLRAFAVARQPFHRSDEALLVFERIGAGVAVFDRFAAFLVVDGEGEVEAAQQLDEPLVDQAFRHQDQGALGAAAGQLLRGDQTGFDGLAEADLVRQQQPRRAARGGNFGHAQLVRNQVDARAQHAPARMRARQGAAFERFAAQLETVVAIHAPGQQAGVGLRYRLFGIEFAFVVGEAVAVVAQQAVAVVDAFDQFAVAVYAHAVAGAERRAHQRRLADSVVA